MNLQINTSKMGRDLLHFNPSKRTQTFERLVQLYRKNDNDQKIPEFNDKDNSRSYILNVKQLTNLKVPQGIGRAEDWTKFSTQFHLTFFYENKKSNERFFFGRSSRTKKIPLKQDKYGDFSTNEKEMDTLWFHTCLGKNSLDDKLFLIIECVIIAEGEIRGDPITRHFSGGFAKFKL